MAIGFKESRRNHGSIPTNSAATISNVAECARTANDSKATQKTDSNQCNVVQRVARTAVARIASDAKMSGISKVAVSATPLISGSRTSNRRFARNRRKPLGKGPR